MARKKIPSLAYQMRQAVNQNFNEGTSKRAAKMSEGGCGSTVYSYKHRKDLIELASQFATYCHQEFNVKFAKDITSEHTDSFLKSKAETCSAFTLKTYHSNLTKLSKVVQSAYSSCTSDFTEGVLIPTSNRTEKLRDAKMSRESMDKVLDCLNFTHASHRAIALAECLGLRASETVRLRGSDIDLERNVVCVTGKGGRAREIEIQSDSKELLENFKEQYQTSRIAEIKSDSVNTTLKRICEREDIHDLDDCKSGIHAIRKLWATEMFEEKLTDGLSEKHAWGDVAEVLGHSRDRTDLFHAYIVR